ncbi:phage portal protein [Vallitaleaceae bacterium 9-2]|mgnify:CR=1 FL=1
MGNLAGFLAQNAKKIENIQYVVSKRFTDEEGTPIPWEIRCITSTEDEALRKSCTKRVQVPGKRGQFTQETDYNLYLGKLAATCTVHPNLDDMELQNSYNAMGADLVLKNMLSPGEYSDYLIKIQEVNGFEVSFEEKVEEAKN